MGEKQPRHIVTMKQVLLLLLVQTISTLKISPFIPRDMVKHQVDIARVNYIQEKLVLGVTQRAGEVTEEGSGVDPDTTTADATIAEPEAEPSYSKGAVIAVGSVGGGLVAVVVVSYIIARLKQ